MVLTLGVVLAATSAACCRVDSMGFFLLCFKASGHWSPTGGLNAELLCVLCVQSLPAAELHGIGADHASNRLTREEPLKDVEADVPARGAPRDEAAIDVVPQRQARTAANGFEFPPRIVVLKHLGSVG